MSEEVKIVVRQESQGTALEDAKRDLESFRREASKQFPQTQAGIDRLHKSAAVYESKAMTDAAKSARSDAASLQGDLDRHAKEQFAAHRASEAEQKKTTKDRVSGEKEITDEMRRREAVGSARARMATNLAERAAGVSGMGEMTSLVSGIGGTAGIAATVAMSVAAVGTAIAGAIQDRARSSRLLALEDNTATVRQGQHLKRMAEPGGSDAASANAEEKAAHDEVIERTEQGKEIKEKAKPRWWKWRESGLWAYNKLPQALRGGDGEDLQTEEGREEDQKNDKAKERALKREAGAKEIKKKKWAEEGTVELEGRKAELNHDMVGKRFADDKLAAVREYNRIVNAIGGSTPKEKADAEAVATEGATSLVQLRQRERAGNVAGLVNARTGTRGTAQLARFAAGLDSPGRAADVVAAIHSLQGTVKDGSQPPLRDWMQTRGR